MLFRIAYSTYCAGIGASGLYGVYVSDKEFNVDKQTKKYSSQQTEFITYNAYCVVGLTLGMFVGIVWPIAVVGKTFSMISNINAITKNN